MGCTPSKLNNQETVRRCKERRRLIKHSMHLRHRLSAAHSDYCHSLRTTGAALSTFAAGEPLPVSGHSAAAILHRKIPPPLEHRRKIASLPENRRERSPEAESRRRRPMRVPHILSDSTSNSSTTTTTQNENAARITILTSNTSQTSSVWNWDEIKPPPTPPDSEYFERLRKDKRNHDKNSDEGYYGDCYNENEDKDSSFISNSEIRSPFSSRNDGNTQFGNVSSYSHSYSANRSGDYTRGQKNAAKDSIFMSKSDIRSPVDQFQIPFSSRNGGRKHFDSYSDNRSGDYTRGQKNGANVRRWERNKAEEIEREEVECSEWGDHDHFTSTGSSSDEDGDLKMKARNDGKNSNLKTEANANVENVDSSKLSSNSTEGNGKNKEADSDKSVMVKHKDLLEIVNALKEYFDKAADAGDQVSQMLEIDRNFTQLRKTEYHSNGMLSNLNSSWMFKPQSAVKYRDEPDSIKHGGCSKSLRFTLERLLVWETKLYQEVKARESVKMKLEKELPVLQSQEEEYRGIHDAKLDKKKASIRKLQSLLSMKSQDVSATSSAIMRLRDSDLVPQLVELCHGFMYMWKSMNRHHEIQNSIVQQVQGLVNHTTKGGSTTPDLHRQATRDLQFALSTWYTTFRNIMKFQRDFISSLHGWFKLTLLHVNGELTKGSSVLSFLDEWKLALDRVPDSIPSEAIKSFINVVNSIYMKQNEDVKIRKRAESFSKELERKGTSLRNVERKYYKSYSTVGLGIPDNVPDSQGWGPLAEKKAELSTSQKRVEDEMAKYWKAVEETRAVTLNNIQTGLPGVFQAAVSFSGMMVEALETVCNRSYAI